MTDNGLAALAAALERVAMRPSGLSIASYEEHAAAILDPRGVFLPDGHPLGVEDAIAQGQQMLAERDATIATLRAAPSEAQVVDNCIAIIQQSLDTVRAEDDGESRSMKMSIAAREHVIALLTGYRERAIATAKEAGG